jgi:hypothetical protein
MNTFYGNAFTGDISTAVEVQIPPPHLISKLTGILFGDVFGFGTLKLPFSK